MPNPELNEQIKRQEAVVKIFEVAKQDPEHSAEFNAILSVMEQDAREKLAQAQAAE